MKIVIAPDKFKGTLSSIEFCEAAAQGVREAIPGAEILCFPLSDGGDGFTEVMHSYGGFRWINIRASDPLFREREAFYLLSADGKSAVIELAGICGLSLLKAKERDPGLTTTAGLGQLIEDALSRGVEKIFIGLGGSATNDGGLGMAESLGFRFLDKAGHPLPPIGKNLIHIQHILPPGDPGRLKTVRFVALTDVSNPLYGKDGAAFTYAAQKGADKAEIELLDSGLRHLSECIQRWKGVSVAAIPGSGAAGGAGAGCAAFLDAALQSGSQFMLRHTALEKALDGAALVITGEGKLDHQSILGKLPMEVARLAAQKGIPVAAVAGQAEEYFDGMEYFSVIRTVLNEGITLKRSINESFTHVKKIVYDIVSQIK